MEIIWKWVNLYFGLLFFQLCSGFPINLEESVADKHTQFLTGLVAVLLTVCSIVLLAGCLCCQRRNGFKEFRDSPVIASVASNLDHGHVNPVANGEFTIFTPLTPPHYNNNVFLANERIITRTTEDYVYGDFDVSSWFNETEKDFPRIKLKYIKELGRGWFGKVVEGAAKDLQNDQSWTSVVVRILDATASRKERVLFLNDAAIYKCGAHPNILFLIGRCLDTVPLLLLQEYCAQGDLKMYLRTKKENADKLLTTDHLLLWCCQLSSALKHLHDNKVTHPDLAARNCQLTSNLILKLGDYGLAVFNYPEDYYQGSHGVPVRWCSPESLNCTSTTIQPKRTTPESNIWSLSVTIWEILECGEQPYPGLSDDEVVSQVLGSNIRLTRPSYPFLYADYMYRLMQLCWTSAESRPAMAQINLMLTDLLQVHKNTKNNMLSANDFDKRWEFLKPNAIVKTNSISDTINSELEEIEVNSKKPLSPSLNNLHGSLDDLLLHSGEIEMDSWSENITRTDEFPYAKNFCKTIQDLNDPLAQDIFSSDSSGQASPKLRESKIKSKIDFDLTSRYYDNNSKYTFSDSVLFSQRTSSESETEDENWRNKVERGAYTEKVRLKSRSVADLMILTHVDYSESESETPLPSLDYRTNYKNVRYAPKNNLENVSLTYGSEGNLLNVHDTFQHDLKKMQEERRDSLLFVPDNNSQTSVFKLDNNRDNLFMTDLTLSESNISKMHLADTPSKCLMHELNSTADIKPANQVFNVFNVTIDKFNPIQVNNCKLNEIINFNKDISCFYNSENREPIEKKSSEGLKRDKNSTEDLLWQNNQQIYNNQNFAQKSNCITNVKHISDLSKNTYLPDTRIEMIKTCSDTVVLNKISDDEGVNNSNVIEGETTREVSKEENSKICKELENQHMTDNKSLYIHVTDLNNLKQHMEPKTYISQVPSLSDIILNNKLICSIINFHDKDKNNGKFDTTHKNDNKIINTEKYESHSSKDNAFQHDSETYVEENKECNEISNSEIAKKGKLPHGLDIAFDLSSDQEEIMPNAMTHIGGFTSTPFGKKQGRSLQSEVVHSSLNLFNDTKENNEYNEDKEFFPNITTAENTCDINNKELNYSLETWDNFLGKTLDNQNEILNENLFDSFSSEPHSLLFVQNVDKENSENEPKENLFDSFSSEPHSLLFVQNVDEENNQNKPEIDANTFDVLNETFLVEDENNRTFIIDKQNQTDDSENESLIFKSNTSQSDDAADNCNWESGGGWFLHPQSNEELSGVIEVTSANTDSYVGFGIDDEIMAAIRNELLTKLPQAQVATSEKVQEVEEWDSNDRDEVFLKYNVYNPPLSPILEESYIEDTSGVVTPKQESEIDDSEWSQPCIPEILLPDIESQSAHTYESSLKEPHHRHTPSQDSCCSNDTLFNLEELTCAVIDFEKEKDISLTKNMDEKTGETIVNEEIKSDIIDHTICSNENEITKKTETNNNEEKNLNSNTLELVVPQLNDQVDVCEQKPNVNDYDQSNLECDINQLNEINISEHKNVDNTHYINNFLNRERDYTSKDILIAPYFKQKSSCEENSITFTKCQIAPLPSPEDNPWKQLPASMLSYDKVKSQSNASLLPIVELKHIVPEYNDCSKHVEYENINKFNEQELIPMFDNNQPNYVNYDTKDINPVYENIDKTRDLYNEADYVNIENLENTRNNISQEQNEDINYVNVDISKTKIIKNATDNNDDSCIFGMLTDIKFNGPNDNHLLSTSFSESNDINDEQDWDSGSDTRSSSSGEFIWKEGEHEESLKALRAAPQDTENINPSVSIAEESSDESEVSSSTSGEEGETPEFIPSAWDKFATPTKSALRSPEKTLEKSDRKKAKGVWFKKQKYHCIYEYPREPESPVLQSEDLWKLQNSEIDYNSFTDWEFDADNYLPLPIEDNDITPSIYQPKSISTKNLYQLTNITDIASSVGNTGTDDEFFISNSAGLLDMIGSLSSQFFPGNTNWATEKATPDSGVEDITPGSLMGGDEFSVIKMPNLNSVQTLRKLAAEAVHRNKRINRNNDVLGGLRHTRNMLTLDLPLSPSAFTSAKSFTVEPALESVVREKPTFTTFGKSRFLVQHVDTPPDECKSKNVSFEALPYTPLKECKIKVNSFEEELCKNSDQYSEISHGKHVLKDQFEIDNCKTKFELVKGEASLLDSADEDSGIESSTLERKLSYNALS